MSDEQTIAQARAAVERAWATLLPTIKALQDAERALRMLAGDLAPAGPPELEEDAPPAPPDEEPEEGAAPGWGDPRPMPAGVVARPWRPLRMAPVPFKVAD